MLDYADDAILYSTIHTLADCTNYSKTNTLSNWATTWNMSFNPDKCEYLKITFKHIIQLYTINNIKIKEVSSASYLDITINHHLTWSNHTDNICNKALSVKAFLQWNLTSCPSNYYITSLYDKINPRIW